MRQLLEAGVHFGHQTKRWHPKMKKYIFTSRNDIHIIDLQQTLKLIHEAYSIVRQKVERGGKCLFVGTKKQAQEAIEEEAKRCGMYFVNQRWLGGTLTNFETIRKSIRKLKSLEQMKTEGIFDLLSSKEVSKKTKELMRLHHYIGGITEMKKLPDIIFIIDLKKEAIAVTEANRLGIPIVAVVDTNCDPGPIQHPIPGNDDAIRAIKLVSSVIANAVMEGRANQVEGVDDGDESSDEFTMDVDAERIMEDYLMEEEARMRHAKIRRKPTGTEASPAVPGDGTTLTVVTPDKDSRSKEIETVTELEKNIHEAMAETPVKA